MGGREAAAGKLITGRWRGRRRRRREEGSCFPSRIGWKLLQRRRAVPAAPAPRRAPEPSRAEPRYGLGRMLQTPKPWGHAPNPWSLPFTQLCHSNGRDVTRCKGKDTVSCGSLQSAFLLVLDTLKAVFVTCKYPQFSAAFLQL